MAHGQVANRNLAEDFLPAGGVQSVAGTSHPQVVHGEGVPFPNGLGHQYGATKPATGTGMA